MAQREDEPQFPWWPVVAAGVFMLALAVGGDRALKMLESVGIGSKLPASAAGDNIPLHPLTELLKLVAAALIGATVTAVHRRFHRDRPLPRSLQQAQVLLCLAGALVMIIIGNSIARAFGVAGAAGIVRFRTPVEDPKDTTLLFLLITLGMACGIGQLEVAAMGTIFLCCVLAALDRIGEPKGRNMILSLVASGKDFPDQHVLSVLKSSVDSYEVREVVRGPEAVVKYSVILPHTAPLSWLSNQLMANGASGLKSVSWQEAGKKGN